MRKGLIIALACINVALLLGLMYGAIPSEARAQGYRQTDYLMIPCQVDNDEDAIFVIDLARQRLGAYRCSVSGKKITSYRYRSLTTDFKVRTSTRR